MANAIDDTSKPTRAQKRRKAALIYGTIVAGFIALNLLTETTRLRSDINRLEDDVNRLKDAAVQPPIVFMPTKK